MGFFVVSREGPIQRPDGHFNFDTHAEAAAWRKTLPTSGGPYKIWSSKTVVFEEAQEVAVARDWPWERA